MKVKILSINRTYKNTEIIQENFENASSFSDYDVLIIDPKYLFPKLYAAPATLLVDGSYYTNAGHDIGYGNRIMSLFDSRRKEITNLLQVSQGVILCFLSKEQESLTIMTAGRFKKSYTNYSWIPDWLPVASAGGRTMGLSGYLTFVANRGTEITSVDMRHPVSRFFRAFKEEIQFECALKIHQSLEPYVRVLARNKVGEIISCEISIEGGSLIFLPTLRSPSPEKEAGVLLDCIEGILGIGYESPPPSWVENFKLPGETIHEEAIKKLGEQIKKLDIEKYGLEEKQNKVMRFKGLLYEKGKRALEPLVREAFRLFDFNVLEPDAYSEDFDLYIKEDGLTIIGEIEGTDNSFIEVDKYRQLLDYVEQESDKGIQCKGVLVGNAWRGTNPAERKEQFSSTAVARAQQRGFCLITTYQLFEIAKRILSGITDQELEGIRAKIISCKGIFSLGE